MFPAVLCPPACGQTRLVAFATALWAVSPPAHMLTVVLVCMRYVRRWQVWTFRIDKTGRGCAHKHHPAARADATACAKIWVVVMQTQLLRRLWRSVLGHPRRHDICVALRRSASRDVIAVDANLDNRRWKVRLPSVAEPVVTAAASS